MTLRERAEAAFREAEALAAEQQREREEAAWKHQSQELRLRMRKVFGEEVAVLLGMGCIGSELRPVAIVEDLRFCLRSMQLYLCWPTGETATEHRVIVYESSAPPVINLVTLGQALEQQKIDVAVWARHRETEAAFAED